MEIFSALTRTTCLALQTVEWSAQVAQILLLEQQQKKTRITTTTTTSLNSNPLLGSSTSAVSHFILPDLPTVFSPLQQEQFFHLTTRKKRIQTIAASRWDDPDSLAQFVRQTASKVDKLLIVGGNEKESNNNSTKKESLTSIEAIEIAKEVTNNTDIWAVTNPNDENSSRESVSCKIKAGANGIVTQPLLSTAAMDVFNQYPRQYGDRKIAYIAGLALPKTRKGLLFWLKLLNQPELENDAVFREHLDWFGVNDDDDDDGDARGKRSLEWASHQRNNLLQLANSTLDGIHYMPMKNTQDLLQLLMQDTEARQ